MKRTKVKAIEIVLFVCLLVSCFAVPRFVTSQLLSGITSYEGRKVGNEKMVADLSLPRSPVFPEGGWVEQVIRLGLIGVTVFYAFRVAKRVDRRPLDG